MLKRESCSVPRVSFHFASRQPFSQGKVQKCCRAPFLCFASCPTRCGIKAGDKRVHVVPLWWGRGVEVAERVGMLHCCGAAAALLLHCYCGAAAALLLLCCCCAVLPTLPCPCAPVPWARWAQPPSGPGKAQQSQLGAPGKWKQPLGLCWDPLL